jgi:hypothetical protein
MKRWEYKVITPGVSGAVGWWGGGRVDTDEIAAELNRLGSLGWELVSTLETSNTTGRTVEVLLLFKREALS